MHAIDHPSPDDPARIPSPLVVGKLVHVNQLVDDFAAARAFYARVFGAQEYWTGHDEAERRDASLFVVGDVCIELFAPRDRTSLLGASLQRFGNSWHSLEFQVADLEAARAALVERGVRIPTYRPGEFLMVHPGDCHGLLLELCPLEMEGDPRIEPGWSAAPWRDEHPLGVAGLHSVGVAVRDLPAARDWLTGLLGTTPAYQESRPGIGADVVGVPMGDTVLELVAARVPESPVADYVGRFGQRLRSIELGVRDVAGAVAHLEGAGLRVVDGSRPGAVAVAEEDNWGVRWEFAAGPPVRQDHRSREE
jgi:catechol 2,3-dioxygenase-like lactoylglutathione lyase family enzyme